MMIDYKKKYMGTYYDQRLGCNSGSGSGQHPFLFPNMGGAHTINVEIK